MQYFRIKNWDKYQKPKRNQVGQMDYLCLYTSTLDDPKIAQMSLNQFALWVRLLLVARRVDNKLSSNEAWLRLRVGSPGTHRRLNLQFLWDLGLLEAISIDPEERRGEDKRGEETNALRSLQKLPFEKNQPPKNGDEVWNDLTEYIRKNGRQMDKNLPFDEYVREVLKSVGGMNKIRLCTDKDFPFLRNDFIKKYNELSQGDVA